MLDIRSLEKRMLDIEKYMESFKESNEEKTFEKQENNFKNLTDKGPYILLKRMLP